MAISYEAAREHLGQLNAVWEQTEPVSQAKVAIVGVLTRVEYSKLGNTKTVKLTLYGMEGECHQWDGSECKYVGKVVNEDEQE